MPSFRIRSLLVMIFVAAVALTSLARPSVNWSVVLPVFVLVLCVFGVCRAIMLPAERVFWLSFLAGLFTYCAFAFGIRVFFVLWTNGGWAPESDSFAERIIWKLIHGEIPARGAPYLSPYKIEDFLSFIVCLHITFGMFLSAVTAFLAQIVTRARHK